ncbi:PEPxxWA-CTERM sorting domain-containing protein [Parasphingorhabdus sp.]|uniref:PEPxxWA-CTERM sorting domain-containing protein n=1 Tax=Parasphingorhabdus sp. TaxID=2709688 RepID=UPI003264B48B
MGIKTSLLGAASIMMVAMPANAAVLSIAGDDDCFGLTGPCEVGSLWRDDLGGVFFTSNATGADPAFTDEWDSFTNPSYDLAYTGGTNVFLEIKIAGIGDTNSAYDVLFNGDIVGQITENMGVNGFQEVRLFNFAIADSALLANNTVIIGASGGDGYSVDYLSLVGDVAGAVPEPATWAFMIFGFGAVGGAMRRQRKANVKVSYA